MKKQSLISDYKTYLYLVWKKIKTKIILHWQILYIILFYLSAKNSIQETTARQNCETFWD